MMTLALEILGAGLLVSASVFLLYNLFLAVASVFRDTPRTPGGDTALRIAVVIPAHNEAGTITPTLECCKAFAYPEDRYQVVVVADNCTDETETVVQKAGVRCLTREDPGRRGKGYALRWAFDRLLAEDHDVFVVLDADCLLPPHALRAAADEVAAGREVLQASYVADNPDSTPVSYAAALGNVIENDLYYRPKSALGWVVALRGTGMAFTRRVLEAVPWGSYSIVEDLDYTMTLYERGHRVTFLPWVEVRSAFPETLEQLRIQRERWAGGNAQMGKGSALRFLGHWMRTRRAVYLDMALTILSQSRPLQLGQVAGLALVAVLGLLTPAAPFFRVLLLGSLLLAAGYVVYGLWGAVRLGITLRRLGLLARIPRILVDLVVVASRGLLGRTETAWERTPRA